MSTAAMDAVSAIDAGAEGQTVTSVRPTARTPRLREEFIHFLDNAYPEDFTDEQLQMMSANIEGAIERRDRPAPVLQLVHSRHPEPAALAFQV